MSGSCFHATCTVDGTCQHTIIRPTCLQANRTSISQGFQGSWNLGYNSSRCAAYFVRVCFDTQTRAQLQRIEASTRLPVGLSQDLVRFVSRRYGRYREDMATGCGGGGASSNCYTTGNSTNRTKTLWYGTRNHGWVHWTEMRWV